MRSADRRAVRFTAYLALCSLLCSIHSAAWAQFGGYGGGYGGGFGGGLGMSLSTGDKFLMMLVAGVAGLLGGVLLSPGLKQFRRYFYIGVAFLAFAYALIGKAYVADGLSYIYSTIIFFAAFFFAKKFGQKIKQAIAEKAPKRPTSLGSAEWATFSHLLENGLIDNGGFILGKFDTGTAKGKVPLQYTGQRHMLTVAPTRSGKGVSSIIPNLLTYEGSVFVVDPKGENALITAMRRCEGTKDIPGMGQDIYLLDPWNLASDSLSIASACFNPLDWIKADDKDAAENAFLLADAIVAGESDGEARFWDEEAKALLMGLILYVAVDESEKDNRTLGRVRDLLTLNGAKFEELLDRMFRHPVTAVRTSAARQASKESELYSSVMATAQSHTHFLDNERIRESLSKSDFTFEQLKEKPTSIYLILPADRLRTYDRWLRLLIQQAITVNARNIEKKPEKPILFMLDEMPALGRLPAVEQAYGLMAGFGMQLWGIAQDLSQIAKVYGDNGWQTFISNSGVIQYFGSRDKMTAEYFSALCGVTTIHTQSLSWAMNKVFGHSSTYGSQSSSSTTNTSEGTTQTQGAGEAQRKLAYPDELMVLKGHQEIVFVENLNPIMAEKVVWHEHRDLKKLGMSLHSPAEEVATVSKPVAVPAARPEAVMASTQAQRKPETQTTVPQVAQQPNTAELKATPSAQVQGRYDPARPLGAITLKAEMKKSYGTYQLTTNAGEIEEQKPEQLSDGCLLEEQASQSFLPPKAVAIDDQKLQRLADNLSTMGKASSPKHGTTNAPTSPDRFRGKPGTVMSQKKKKS